MSETKTATTSKIKPWTLTVGEVREVIASGKHRARIPAPGLNESLFRDKWPKLKATAIECALSVGPFKVGDKFWVREPFWHDEPFHMDYCASCIYVADHPADYDPRPGQDYPFVEFVLRKAREMDPCLSRITLEIESVNLETFPFVWVVDFKRLDETPFRLWR